MINKKVMSPILNQSILSLQFYSVRTKMKLRAPQRRLPVGLRNTSFYPVQQVRLLCRVGRNVWRFLKGTSSGCSVVCEGERGGKLWTIGCVMVGSVGVWLCRGV